MPKLLTPKEVAEMLGKAEQTLASWRCTQRFNLPFKKIGGSIRYVETDVLEFIDRSDNDSEVNR